MTLLDRPAQWSRGIGGADKDGRECAPGHKAATCLCLYQAIAGARVADAIARGNLAYDAGKRPAPSGRDLGTPIGAKAQSAA